MAQKTLIKLEIGVGDRTRARGAKVSWTPSGFEENSAFADLFDCLRSVRRGGALSLTSVRSCTFMEKLGTWSPYEFLVGKASTSMHAETRSCPA